MRRRLYFLTVLIIAAAAVVNAQKPVPTPEPPVDFSGTWVINKHDAGSFTFSSVVIVQNGFEMRMAQTSPVSGSTTERIYYGDGRGEVNLTDSGKNKLDSKSKFKDRTLTTDIVVRDGKTNKQGYRFKWVWKLSKDGKVLTQEYISDLYLHMANGGTARYNRVEPASVPVVK